MRKKFLALMLSLSMVVSLASCGGSGSKQASSDKAPAASAAADEADLSDIIPDKTVTLTVFDQLANYSGEQVGWFGKMLLDKFNVKLNIVPDPEGQGVFETRMESGDLGDIVIFGSNGDKYKQAIKQGLLWDWNDEDLLTEYGSYIKEHMADAIDKNTQSNGGTCYGYGNDVGTDPTDIKGFDYHPDLRYDLYQQIGSPKIATLEDYEDVLEKW